VSLTLLPSEANLVEVVSRRVQASGDPGSAVVVFPGKRPAHFLRQQLARARGSAFIPPRILSMDELVDQLFEARDAREGIVRPRAEPIDAAAILYEIQLTAGGPLGGSSFMTLDAFFPLGLRIQGDLEELLIEEVPPRDVAGVQPLVEEAVPIAARQRLLSLSEFYGKFYSILSERSLSTRSSRYVSVSRRIDPSDFPGEGPIILGGFFTLTRAERAIFRALSQWPRTQLVFQDGPGVREKIRDTIPLPLEEPARRSPPDRPRVSFTSSPDTHGQVFALNAALEDPDEDTLIVLPSAETLFPLLRHCLSRFDAERYNISLPYPLDRTPLYGFFNALMEVVGSMDGPRVYLPAYVAFVLHPYVKNLRWGASAEATRVLFHTLEERLEQTRTRRFLSLEEIESDAEAFLTAAGRLEEDGQGPSDEELRAHLVDIHDRTIRLFRSFASIRDFAGRCITLVAWVHDHSTAREHPLFTPFSESIVESLETIARSLMADKSFSDLRSYFTLLRTYLRSRHVSFPGTPLHGMQVLGGLETRSLQFARVYVLDADEGSFPEAFRESTLLPFSVRQALGLSTSRDQDDSAAYHFELLAAGARELHLFTVDRADRQRSRFVERLLWEEQKKRGTAEERGLVRSISYRVSLTNPAPLPVPKTPEVASWLSTASHSATSLDSYLQCPLKFYYRTVLRLAPKEELSTEIESREVGTLVHSVLAAYFQGRTGRPLTPADLDAEALRAVLDRQFTAQFGSAESGANRLLRDQVERHLREFLTEYLGPLAASHRIEIRAVEHDASADWNGFRLRGRMDVVESRDGKPLLIDYKTSSNRAGYRMRLDKLSLGDRETWNRAIPTLQLPLYVLLHAAESGVPPVGIQAQFLILGRSRMDSGIELPLFEDPGAAHESWAVIDTVLKALLQEIVSPDVPFYPAPDLRSACPRCDFTAICGTGWLKRA
jgi:ATP-dependent helicase/nuclease subunit B